MTSSIQGIRDAVQSNFDEEYNKALESLEIAGGTISVGGMGIKGIHNTFSGLKAWNDKRKGIDEKGNMDINTKGKGEVIEGKPIESGGTPPKSSLDAEGSSATGEGDSTLTKSGGAFKDGSTTEPIDVAENESRDFIGGIEKGGRRNYTNQFNTNEKVPMTESESSDIMGDIKRGGRRNFDNQVKTGNTLMRHDIKAPINSGESESLGIGRGSYGTATKSQADEMLGGADEHIFDKPVSRWNIDYKEALPEDWGRPYVNHNTKMGNITGSKYNPKSIKSMNNDIGGGTANYRGEGKTEELPHTTREGEERINTRTERQFIGEEDQTEIGTRGRATTLGAEDFGDIGDDSGNIRPRANTVANYRDITTTETYKPEIYNPEISITEEAEANALPTPAVLQNPNSIDTMRPAHNYTPAGNRTIGTTQHPLLEDPDAIQPAPAIPRQFVAENDIAFSNQHTSAPVATKSEGVLYDAGLSQSRKFENFSSQYKGAGGELQSVEGGLAKAPTTASGLGEGVSGIKTGIVESAETTATSLTSKAGGIMDSLGGVAGGVEAEGFMGKIASKGIMSAIGEMGAVGVGSAVVGSLAPIAEVVGAGFMVAGLVKDLTEHPEKVPDYIAGGVSGKVGFDAGAIGGDEKGGIGVL